VVEDAAAVEGGPVSLGDGAKPGKEARVGDGAPKPEAVKPPTCGNGKLDAGEECDGTDLGQKTCVSLGYTGGELKCGAACALDKSGCQGTSNLKQFGEKCGGGSGNCASGLICVLFNESGSKEGYCTAECSSTKPCPTTPKGAECAFELQSTKKSVCGFICSAQNPTCPPGLACTLSTSGGFYYCTTDPPAVCGNGKIDGFEECDGAQLNNMTCQGFGYTGGQLKCDASCKIDKSGCTGASSCSNLPSKDCTGGTKYCSELILFPAGNAYAVTHPAFRSWLRRDTVMLVQWAAASVACLMPGSWPIGLGDMSEQNGAIPGTSIGQPGHPAGTHVNGVDIDMAYFQTGQTNNNLRPVCEHTKSGADQYHCVAPPTILDAPRSALLVAKFLESSRTRVIGVDGQIGPLLQAEAKNLYAKGLISKSTLNGMAFETTDTGKGWFLFHHHHMHVSTFATTYPTPEQPLPPLPEAASASVPMPSIIPGAKLATPAALFFDHGLPQRAPVRALP
jgi:hypothetical protein